MGKWVQRSSARRSRPDAGRLSVGARVGVGVFVCLAAVLVASGGTKAAPRRVLTNSVTFQDSLNENSAASDIDKVTVSNDDAGVVTFQIAIPNRPQFVSPMEVSVILDLIPGDVALGRWNGSDFSFGSSPSSLSYSYSNGIATIHVNASDLQLT